MYYMYLAGLYCYYKLDNLCLGLYYIILQKLTKTSYIVCLHFVAYIVYYNALHICINI